MAYEDTHCPCGGHKERETMLCRECEQEFAEKPESRVLRDPTTGWAQRRGAAIRLIAMSRKRRTKPRQVSGYA